MPDKAQIPGDAVAATGDDFTAPTSNLLVGLGLLGTENKDKQDGLNELKEGALAVSKWVSGIAGAGGVAGVATAVGSAFTSAHEPTRVALIAGGTAVAVAAALAVAIVVQADVRSRAAGTVAQYEARSRVSAAFLALSGGMLHGPEKANGSLDVLYALAGLPQGLRVRAKDYDEDRIVTGVQRTSSGELQLRLEGGDWVDGSDIETFRTLRG